MVPAEELEKMTRTVPLGRFATPEDIADVVVFLASDEAAYVTGEVVKVNGAGVKQRRW